MCRDLKVGQNGGCRADIAVAARAILRTGWPDDFCLFLFSPCYVANARRSFGYACALRLAGQKNKFAKISSFHPAQSMAEQKYFFRLKNVFLYRTVSIITKF